MSKKIPFDQHWGNICDCFNFEMVSKVMKHLDWKWGFDEEPPSMGKIVTSAQKRCKDAYDEACRNESGICTISSGGFEACYNKHEDYMYLKFVLFESDSYDYERE